MVVYYPNTVWKKGYAKHDVTGKTCDIKKGEKGICHQVKVEDFSNQHPLLSWSQFVGSRWPLAIKELKLRTLGPGRFTCVDPYPVAASVTSPMSQRPYITTVTSFLYSECYIPRVPAKRGQ